MTVKKFLESKLETLQQRLDEEKGTLADRENSVVETKSEIKRLESVIADFTQHIETLKGS